MLWNHHRMVAVWTGAMVFFSPDAGRQTEYVAGAGYLGSTVAAVHANAPVAHRPDGMYSIYLTFDDGPSKGSRLVNELSEKDSLLINVFLIGRNVCLTDRSRALFREYQANPRVEIGNHSYSHAERRYQAYFKNPLEVLADFDRSRDSLHLGNDLTRLPGRNFFRLDSFWRNDLSNGKEAADTLAARGYQVFGWDIEWRRRPSKGFDLHTGKEMLDIVNNLLEKQKTFLPGRLIILMHDPELEDDHFRSELESFIQLARADGRYRFEHLSGYSADR